ncbi:MAG: hypothetical protein ABWY18_11590 [Tardiphaga sp.]
MPVYFFHVTGGRPFQDLTGTELIDLNAARREAIMITREIILTPDGGFSGLWDGAPAKLWVTDGPHGPVASIERQGAEKTILTLEISATSAEAA